MSLSRIDVSITAAVLDVNSLLLELQFLWKWFPASSVEYLE